MKYLIEDTTLTGIADAIREKKGTTDLIQVSNLATEISNIQGGGTVEELTVTSNGTYNPPAGIDGYAPVVVNVPQDGGPPAEALVLTGNCEYRFANGGWSWFIREYGDKITTKDVSNCNNMFYKTDGIDRVPFDINLSSTDANNLSNMFSYNESLTTVPYLRGNLPKQTGNYSFYLPMDNLFNGSSKLKTIPEDWFETFGGEEFWTARHSYSNNNSSMFSACMMLRNLPRLDNVYCKPSGTFYCLYSYFLDRCYALDEAVDIPIEDATFTSNAFNNTFSNCYRLKRLTFKTNEDGSAKTASWKSQTIDLTKYVGMGPNDYQMTEQAGMSPDKKVSNVDVGSYERLKNDPDWWTIEDCWNYCRYNHDSAVETINSLPDTSAYLATAGGTNTIKFTGRNGRDTDGGAINTLTESEIAVATAKGWTVSLA